MHINDVTDPVPATNTGVYIDEVTAIITILFRAGIAEIVLGLAVAVFAVQMFIWPIAIGLFAILFGINCMCHFREFSSVVGNSCCCGPLTSVLFNCYAQPFMAMGCVGAAVCACIVLVQRTQNGEAATSIAMAGAALVSSLLLMIPAVWAWTVFPRLLKLTEVHPDIGDPEKIREHGEVFQGIARHLELQQLQRRQQENRVMVVELGGGEGTPAGNNNVHFIHHQNGRHGTNILSPEAAFYAENDAGNGIHGNDQQNAAYPLSATVVIVGTAEQENGRAVNPEERLARRRRIFEAQLNPNSPLAASSMSASNNNNNNGGASLNSTMSASMNNVNHTNSNASTSTATTTVVIPPLPPPPSYTGININNRSPMRNGNGGMQSQIPFHPNVMAMLRQQQEMITQGVIVATSDADDNHNNNTRNGVVVNEANGEATSAMMINFPHSIPVMGSPVFVENP